MSYRSSDNIESSIITNIGWRIKHLKNNDPFCDLRSDPFSFRNINGHDRDYYLSIDEVIADSFAGLIKFHITYSRMTYKGQMYSEGYLRKFPDYDAFYVTCYLHSSKNPSCFLKIAECKNMKSQLKCDRGIIGSVDRESLFQKLTSDFPDDDVTLACSLYYNNTTIVKMINIQPSTGSDSTLGQNLEELLSSEQEADILIEVLGEEFKSHRCILSARSPVFAGMLKKASKKNGVIKIRDCNPDYFKVFLVCLYTGKTDLITCENGLNIYYIAEKYAVKELKKQCVETMARDLSINSICDVITLASTYGELNLLQIAENFFCENVEDIITTSQWYDFQLNNSVLSIDLFLKTVTHLKNTK